MTAPHPPAPVLVLSNCPWHSQWRRRQQIASRLARHRPVVYCDPPFSALDVTRGRRAGADLLDRRPSITRHESGVDVVHGCAGIPAQRFWSVIALLNARRQRRWARRTLIHVRARGPQAPPIVICYEPLLHPLASLEPRAALVYDAADDYARLSRSRFLRDRIAGRMEGLAAAAELTIAASATLQRHLAPHARRTVLLPHGVALERFGPDADRGTEFSRLRDEPGLKAVFHGTLDRRLDPQILLALLRGGVRLLLAGECAWDRATFARLRAAGNLRYFGVLDQAAAAALVAAADVGIIPYRPLPGMESAQTLKRLEFHAAGLPIVATDMDPYRAYRDELALADGPQAFLDRVRSATTDPVLTPDQRLAIAAANTWDARVSALEGWLRELESGRVTATA